MVVCEVIMNQESMKNILIYLRFEVLEGSRRSRKCDAEEKKAELILLY